MSIKSSISDFFKVEELRDNVFKLAESKFQLKKLELLGKIEKIAAKLIMQILAVLFIFMFFIVLNIFIAVAINHYTSTFWIGFACILAFYAVLFAIFHFNKPKISKVIQAKIADFIVKEDV